MTNVILKPNQAVTLLLQCFQMYCIVLYCRHFDFPTSKHFGFRDTDKKKCCNIPLKTRTCWGDEG